MSFLKKRSRHLDFKQHGREGRNLSMSFFWAVMDMIMMLSIFQGIVISCMWWRWVKWREWWQNKSKLKGCWWWEQGRQLEQHAQWLSLCLCIVIYQMICPWDLVSSNGCSLSNHVFAGEMSLWLRQGVNICTPLSDFINSSHAHLITELSCVLFV